MKHFEINLILTIAVFVIETPLGLKSSAIPVEEWSKLGTVNELFEIPSGKKTFLTQKIPVVSIQRDEEAVEDAHVEASANSLLGLTEAPNLVCRVIDVDYEKNLYELVCEAGVLVDLFSKNMFDLASNCSLDLEFRTDKQVKGIRQAVNLAQTAAHAKNHKCFAIAYRKYQNLHNIYKKYKNQFGYKKKLSSKLAYFFVNEVSNYYREHGSNIHLPSLDATKAFDKLWIDVMVKYDGHLSYCLLIVLKVLNKVLTEKKVKTTVRNSYAKIWKMGFYPKKSIIETNITVEGNGLPSVNGFEYLGLPVGNNKFVMDFIKEKWKKVERSFYSLLGHGVKPSVSNPSLIVHPSSTVSLSLDMCWITYISLVEFDSRQSMIIKRMIGLKKYAHTTPLNEALRLESRECDLQEEKYIILCSIEYS
ncbi:hypothetical protein BpHYR1_014381 [Brachionus plicatilis]|uniref:RNA-directed DNA polymerase from mobile element jockey-like n=1 Tax=Brachionus plicatilis TaxID=10195 RepID=A0A3M7RLX1_BRAPC|nr:hypothetical protein BpHYR1_014381 [Brachionus plicatilis]